MQGDAYFSLTALPVLDPPGAAPPLTLPDFLARVPSGRAHALASAVLLGDDLLQREALHAGEAVDAQPAVLTPEQVRGEAPLPAGLEPAEGVPVHGFAADLLWEAYYAHAADVARRHRSEFLAQWVGTEVRLRNELARARAQALGLAPAEWLVAVPLQGSAAAVEAALTAWQEAADPLAGLQALLVARWRWIEQQEPLYTFAADEYPAYAAKLSLLHRWQRCAQARTVPGGSAR